jgi:O-acetyl-ADP-ribose deacetylase (regulator of RNase III)
MAAEKAERLERLAVLTKSPGGHAAGDRYAVRAVSFAERSHPLVKWSNRSVLALAAGSDPVAALTEVAQRAVLEARDAGWTGPPFDPVALARLRGVHVVGSSEVSDARTVVDESGELRIEFNPGRPGARTRYSIAHEVAHTLFPDCAEHVRNRSRYHESIGDEWQLETLCNLAAAEFLMPTGSFPDLGSADLDIDRLLHLRQEFGVSIEAVLVRAARSATTPVAMFAASPIERGPLRSNYRVEYVVSSPFFAPAVRSGAILGPTSRLGEASAIGYTTRFDEEWAGQVLHVEAVGIPPHPGTVMPRAAGIVTWPTENPGNPKIRYLRGDALQPRGDGARILAQVVNNATPNWGGRGFAFAVRSRFPSVQTDFQRWVATDRRNLELGKVRLARTAEGLYVFSMVAQEGYGLRGASRLRYSALHAGLLSLAKTADELNASVHMPRIGTGYAGGSWEIISELIEQEISSRGIPVTVYDLPTSIGSAPSVDLKAGT